MAGRSGRTLARVALSIAGTLLGLALCELGLRVHAARDHARRTDAWAEVGEARMRAGGEVGLGHLVRPSPERRIVYELIPGLDVRFKDARVAVNSAGSRGPEVSAVPEPGAVRILGLGDSVLFGWGVEQEQCFLAVLGERLSAAHPGVAFETINLGVPGYNTAMEVEALRLKGLAYRPDLVLIDHVGNDLALPNFLPRRSDAWTLGRSFLWSAVRGRLRTHPQADKRPFDPAPRDGYQFLSDPELVPEPYRDIVGLAAYRRAMAELAELARRHDFDVIVTTHVSAPDYVRETCAELGLELVETQPRLEREMEERGIQGRRGSVLTVSATDAHPSPLAHRLQAEEIHARLMESGLLERLLDRGGR